MQVDGNTIIASEGKWLKRKSDGKLFGKLVALGYTYYLAGKRLEEPLLELPEHYEDADLPPITEEERMMYDEQERYEEMQDKMERELNKLRYEN